MAKKTILVCKITPREGYVYRNYMCKGCNKTGEFFGVRKDKGHTRSETSRHYQCCDCFPKDYNGFGHPVGVLTNEYASKKFYRQRYYYTWLDYLGIKDGLMRLEYNEHKDGGTDEQGGELGTLISE